MTIPPSTEVFTETIHRAQQEVSAAQDQALAEVIRLREEIDADFQKELAWAERYDRRRKHWYWRLVT